MDFALNGPSGAAAGAPRPSPPTNPIPITRGTTAPMAIGAGKRGRGYNNSSNTMYSQSLPSRPRAPIIGSLPAPRMPGFAEMPTLELPPSFSDDEVMRSFGAPGTSLSNASGGGMMMARAQQQQRGGGYAASCPAPSFMMSAAGRRPLRTKADGGSSSGGDGGGGAATGGHGAGATADAQTPSFNSLVGSRTALSVLMEVDETTLRDDDKVGGAGGGARLGVGVSPPGMAALTMENIKLESIDLGGPAPGDGAYDDDGNLSSDGDDGGGLFAMED